ncbi:MAG: hypothetical protein ABJH63_01340 [Rhizobiaceae bacterium]
MLWQKALLGGGDAEDICDYVLEAEYEVYKLHYRDFVESEQAFDPDQRQAWLHHLVIDKYHLPTKCMVMSAHRSIVELLNHVRRVTFRYCGNLATQPQTFDEDYLAAGLDQMLTFASRGVPEAIINMLYYSAVQPNLALNADVEHYLRKTLRQSYRFEAHWGVVHLRPQFARQRQKFIDAAVERQDLATVLETTAPCSAPMSRQEYYGLDVTQ